MVLGGRADAFHRRQVCGWTAQILEQTVRNKNQWLLIAVLAGLLIIVFWYCVTVWQATPAMPVYANIILGVAMTLALVAGCGLTALMYHSRRKGYDEPARPQRKREDQAN
jgi:hypothetical protein